MTTIFRSYLLHDNNRRNYRKEHAENNKITSFLYKLYSVGEVISNDLLHIQIQSYLYMKQSY